MFKGHIEVNGEMIFSEIKGQMSIHDKGGKNGWDGYFWVIIPKQISELPMGDVTLVTSDGLSLEIHMNMLDAQNRVTFDEVSIRCKTK